MAYYINPDAILDNSIKTSSLPKKVQKKVDLYEINKQKPPIVGRCIPLHPEEGNKYYFADGVLKVKKANTVNNSLGFYYIGDISGGIIFTIPRKNTQDYIDLCDALLRLYQGNFPPSYKDGEVHITANIFDLFPIFTHLYTTNDKFNSSTRSPQVIINNGELVVDKPLFYKSYRDLININPKSIYYRYKNNKSKQKHLKSLAFDGVPWEEHRKTLTGHYYEYKYTYRKIISKKYPPYKRGYYKVCSIWRQHKISKNNILYFKKMNSQHKDYTKIFYKLNDKYKQLSNIQP